MKEYNIQPRNRRKKMITIKVEEGSFVLTPKQVEKCVEKFLKHDTLMKFFNNCIQTGRPMEWIYKRKAQTYAKLLNDLSKILPKTI